MQTTVHKWPQPQVTQK